MTAPDAPAAVELLTLPEVSLKLELPLDWLRKQVLHSHELRNLMQRAGPTRLLSADRLEKFKAIAGRPRPRN